MKKIYLSIHGALLFASTAWAQPSNAPTTPEARNAGDVISIFSDAYASSAPNLLVNPPWGQPGSATVQTIGGNEVVAVTGLTYQGIQFDNDPNISVNVSSMEKLHIDLWSETATGVNLSLISNNPTFEKAYTITLNPGWNNIEIPLSFYSPPVQLNRVFQLKFDTPLPAAGVTIYYDNLYFSKSPLTPTISGFNITEKFTTDAPFNLTIPTSNSAGAFTYTSSNTSVATISGTTVTIVGAGATTITVNQAADGEFNPGVYSANLVVKFPEPTTAPTTPPVRNSADVISIYSEAYTNLPNIDFYPGWGQATQLSEQTYAENKVQRMLNFTFQGLVMNQEVDLSGMQNLHIDVWTPDCSSFEISLIYKEGESEIVKEQKVVRTLALNEWNLIDIPLSDFPTGVNFPRVFQMKFEATGWLENGNRTVFYDNLYFHNDKTLPVTLSSFDAKVKDNGVVLTWQTQSESNNNGFVIERSQNGKDWTNIGFEAGKGNSNSLSNYSFEDKTPMLGVNYYRLVQQDNNNKETLSEVKTVNFNVSAAQKINVYPNPATENLFVQLGEIKNDNSSISLVDLKGSVIKTLSLSKLSSSNTIQFPVQNLPAGLYYIILNDANEGTATKVIVK